MHDTTNDIYLYRIFIRTIYAFATVPPFSVGPSSGWSASSSRPLSLSESSQITLRMSHLFMTGLAVLVETWTRTLLAGSDSRPGERARFRDSPEVLPWGSDRGWRRTGVPTDGSLGTGDF